MEKERVNVEAEVLLQLNRNTADGWEENDIVLGEGEPALLLENGVPIGMKYGDGTHKWSELDLIPLGIDGEYNFESDKAQSGKAVAEAVNDKVTVYKGTDISIPSLLEFIIVEEEFNGAGILLPYKEGDIYINTDEDCAYQCVSVDSGTNGGNSCTFKRLNNRVDQIYDSESHNAQSGKAVAQAIANIEISGGGSNLTVVENLTELKTAMANNLSPIMLKAGTEIILGEYLELPENTILYGNNAKIIRQAGYWDTMIRMLPNSRLYDLNIDGGRRTMENPFWANTIEVSTRENCIVENVKIDNGNEAICACQDNVVIRNCKITNCDGNGIHFSGGINIRAENNYINNVNILWKENGVETIGHEDGGIIWSDQCDYVTCIGNYVENAKSVFGAIDAFFNSHIKLIGNTGKDCLCAVDTIHDSDVINANGVMLGTPTDIVISDNEFINCGVLELLLVNVETINEFRFVIANNIFNNTQVKAYQAKDVVIDGNVFKNMSKIAIQVENCIDFVISGNTITGTGDNILYIKNGENITVANNNVTTLGTAFSVQNGTNKAIVVKGNTFKNASETLDYTVVRLGTGMIFSGNNVSLHKGIGINVRHSCICTDNIILIGEPTNANATAIMVYGEVNDFIVMNNITNGKFIFNSTSGTQANNIISTTL